MESNAVERGRLIDGFHALGCRPLESVTNFVSADVGRPGAEVATGLRERGIRVSTWGDDAYPDFIRVSTGLPGDTDAFLEGLRAVLV